MKRSSLALTLLLPLSGCDNDLDARLQQALQATADKVTIGETHVEATCKGGDVVKVPVEKLALDFLGMADIEKQTAVAKELQEGCEELTRKRAAKEREESALGEAAKKLGVAIEGKDAEALKGEVCAALEKQLPRDKEERQAKIAENTRGFGCADPGEPEVGPEKAWRVEDKGDGKKKVAVYLRLDADPHGGEARDQLTVRCLGNKKLEVYLETSARMTKGALAVTVDGKAQKWPASLSKDKKAVFLKDAKKGVKAMLGRDRLTVRLPAKKKLERSFTIDGIEAALDPFEKACGL